MLMCDICAIMVTACGALAEMLVIVLGGFWKVDNYSASGELFCGEKQAFEGTKNT